MNNNKNGGNKGINDGRVLSEQRLTADPVEIETARYIIEKSAEMVIMANSVGLNRLSQLLSQAHAAAEGVVERTAHHSSTPSKDAN